MGASLPALTVMVEVAVLEACASPSKAVIERTRLLPVVGFSEELLYWRASRRASACAVVSSALLSPVKEMVAVPESTATEYA